ncbi:MAG TPA: nitroreductase [Phenylobacterium sp.]|nr:nitroreductase [Phenylobacterium sp.]
MLAANEDPAGASALPPKPVLGEALPLTPAPEVLNFLARRRSVSAPMLTAPAPNETELADLLTLAARVPDHGKLAPWRFIVIRGEAKDALVSRLGALAGSRGDAKSVAKLGKLRTPPLCVAVVSQPKPSEIPEWEQVLSAGAVCTTLTYAALAAGWGANWITDWYAYDDEAKALIGIAPEEKVAGFIMLGTASEPPLERERGAPPSVTVLGA